ncbi:MAG: tRNA epoxyqueuosine(34) reductase QueG [Planctomycetota bacterium]
MESWEDVALLSKKPTLRPMATAISSTLIREIALEAGFDLVAIGPPGPGEHGPRFLDWLDAGRAGEMDYLHRNRERILRPESWLPGVRSSINLAFDYGAPAAELPGGGRVARYAVGRDYHLFHGKAAPQIHTRLVAEGVPQEQLRIGTDAVPILERALSAQAGIGFLAKSAGIISKTHGPYLLLAEVLTPLDLPPDGPSTGSCGSCTACLDACPTKAITAPHQVDATRCLSYTTIELRGFIPEPLREQQGEWFFGCDVCLEVCPFTSKGRAALPSIVASTAERPADLQPHAVVRGYDLVGVLELSEARYQTDWVGTAMRRATRSGLRRNAAVVLGNLGRQAAVPALTRVLGDPDPVVRGHAAWALGRLADTQNALRSTLAAENDPRVLREIRSALDRV